MLGHQLSYVRWVRKSQQRGKGLTASLPEVEVSSSANQACLGAACQSARPWTPAPQLILLVMLACNWKKPEVLRKPRFPAPVGLSCTATVTT